MNGQSWLDMGGYAAFVWPSFAVVIAILVGNALAARRLHRRARETALRRLDAGQGRS